MSRFISNEKYPINLNQITRVEWNCFNSERPGNFAEIHFDSGSTLQLYFTEKLDDDLVMKLEQSLKRFG